MVLGTFKHCKGGHSGTIGTKNLNFPVMLTEVLKVKGKRSTNFKW